MSNKAYHGHWINLDHAATTPLRAEALAAMLPYFTEKAGNASAIHAMGREGRTDIDTARRTIATCIGAEVQEVYFTSGGTEADNWALFGSFGTVQGHLIVSGIEHHAVLHAAEVLTKRGVACTIVAPNEDGIVEPEAVAKAIRPDTRLVSVMLANNEVGTIQSVQQIAAIAHQASAWMHTDAVQAAGHIPIDVRALDVDMLSMSAHKFYGPKGIGALYIRQGVRLERLLYGGAQERGLRAGTENTPGIVGMAEALRLACEEMGQEEARLSALRDRLLNHLQKRCTLRVNGGLQHRLAGNLHISLPGVGQDALLMSLDLAGVMTSAGSACTAGVRERSHVLQAMGVAMENEADLRLTLGRENTEEDIDRAAEIIGEIAGRLHKDS